MSEWELKPHPKITKCSGKQPVVVCILDGWGMNKVKDDYNACHTAKTPNFDRIYAVAGRNRIVSAHGPSVGLPTWDDMGNSEVGHNALGGGQVVDQGAKLVDNALADKSIYNSKGFKHVESAFANNTVHLIGLLSKGGVHARYDQLQKLMPGLAEKGAKRIRLHFLTDGRDVPDGTSVEYAAEVEKDLEPIRAKGVDICVASGGGRMGVTMDRYDSDWKIVEKGWKAHVLGDAPHKFESFGAALTELKKAEGNASSDQWLPPFVITKDGKPVGTIEDNDAVILFNFRADRMVEITKAFEYEDFKYFDRVRFPKTKFVGMMQYDGDLQIPTNFLVDAPVIDKVSGMYLCKNGMKTWACSETQKFGHVTFFWNGNRSGYLDETMETYECIESDKCVFDEKPGMKAKEITDKAIEAIKSGQYDMIRVNYANPDMVGHTGNLAATIRACEICDWCLGLLLGAVESVNGRWLVTADHGNADDMAQREKKTGAPAKDKATGEVLPLKSHTLAPVPVCIGGNIGESIKFKEGMDDAGLANITATYMNLCGFEAPAHYSPSLI